MKKDKRWIAYTHIWFGFVIIVTTAVATVFIRQHKMIREKPAEETIKIETESITPPEPQVIVIQIDRPVDRIVYTNPEDETVLELKDIYLMAKVVHAEAGNQDMVGKRLIADVILNRYYSEDFPDTIEGVVYQTGQFATESLDTYTEWDLEAVYYEINARIDTDVLYFRTGKFHGHGTPLYQHNAHYFSGK